MLLSLQPACAWLRHEGVLWPLQRALACDTAWLEMHVLGSMHTPPAAALTTTWHTYQNNGNVHGGTNTAPTNPWDAQLCPMLPAGSPLKAGQRGAQRPKPRLDSNPAGAAGVAFTNHGEEVGSSAAVGPAQGSAPGVPL